MSEEYQKEFFDDFKSKKGNIEKIADKIAERQPKLYLNMPLENIIFLFIIVIMVVIVAYAFGVERGKAIEKNSKDIIKPIDVKEPKIIREEVSEALSEEKVGPTINNIIEKKEIVKPYTIQLISYKDKRRAEKEKEKLLKKGIDAFILHSGSWHQLCAGKYETIEEAKNAQVKFNNTYQGCIIKKQ